MPWLMPDEVASASVELLATRANLDGWKRICPFVASGDAECEKSVSDTIARIRNAAPGMFVALRDSGAISYA
jgi:hypothetical protein